MNRERTTWRSWFLGSGTLLIRCADAWRAAGHQVAGVVSSDPAVRQWAAEQRVTAVGSESDLAGQQPFDYLFSVGNHSVLSTATLQAPGRLAINFHYGPLPAYAGVHVPVWALLRGERRYGVTWHEMTSEVDGGRIVKDVHFDIPEQETAAGLNARCFDHGFDAFVALVDDISNDRVTFAVQDASKRRLHRRHDRPDGHLVVDFSAPADTTVRLVRAVDFGPLDNAFGVARLVSGNQAFVVTRADSSDPRPGAGDPGEIVEIRSDAMVVSTSTGTLALSGIKRTTGEQVSPADLARSCGVITGQNLPANTERHDATTRRLDAAVRQESYWLSRLSDLDPLPVPYIDTTTDTGATRLRAETVLPASLSTGPGGDVDPATMALALAAVYLARVSGTSAVTLPLAIPELQSNASPLLSPCVPLRVDLTRPWGELLRDVSNQLEEAGKRGSFFLDVCVRYPNRTELAAVGKWLSHIRLVVADDPAQIAPAPDTALALIAGRGRTTLTWVASAAVSLKALSRMQHQLSTMASALAAAPASSLAALPLLDADERTRVLHEWNDTARNVGSLAVHELFERQVAQTPDAPAVVFRDRTLAYRELNRQANRLAAHLRDVGIGPDAVVGVFVDRSIEMVVALLGVLKAGGAYLPLDPAFPQERLAWMLEDTAASVLLTQSHLASALPRHDARVLMVDLPPVSAADDTNISGGARPEHLAYVIFTSGSTGRPKGVMVEHGNVANFFAGMDEYLADRPGKTWLAVTSISFDISVLELFWTLARGFTVVIQEEFAKAASGTTSPAPATGDRGMDFGLFYFSADAAADGGNRYRLLLEGAKYADAHGFSAVWTPERHFHNFGGLYPNPAVTSAAVAAVTSRIRVRAGSVVLPLHNPIRVAEEWAVVDNLSQGRVEMSFASGWHANDFALMPDNYKDRRDIMLQGIDLVRRLWRGESASVTNGHGQPHEVRVFPAPHQQEPPFWIAAAGNIETFRMAGRIGARLLTNLLGQKIDDVAEKIRAYRTAWREAGHSGEGAVALMLHTFVGANLDQVRETVRQPLINYLKSSTELVKQARWEFPAFANPGNRPASDVELTDDDIDAMMTHAFDRYFDTSGLFGTPDMCLARVRELKAIGVDEIACLIDFGVPTDAVLASLPYLNEVRERSQPVESTGGDFTIAAQIERHDVSHLQSTPSLLRAILADERGRTAMKRVSTLMVGGEPLPPALARDALTCAGGALLNMYGPTETTVWSTVAPIADADDVTIGRPIANTQVYIVDRAGAPVPVGVAGELLIGGLGVTRGYWRRPDLTADRFVANSCIEGRSDLLYRTGDLARYRDDGRIECLGRLDHQVKVSGHRIELGEIETALDVHPSVKQSVVVVKPDSAGEARLVAYVVGRSGSDSPDPARWQAVWNETYAGLGRSTDVVDPTFDIAGWRDSYTGQSMPEADMREWVDLTVARILDLEPRSILEIGCGAGLLLHRLAPACDRYVGVDFSPTVIGRLQEAVTRADLTNVTLRTAAADSLAAETDLGTFDAVVINSVIQYFPSSDYLVAVLRQAFDRLKPGGTVFVGDVRSLPLLSAFHTSVELAQAPAHMTTSEIAERVADRVEHDPELVLAPSFFEHLRDRIPAIAEVDVLTKRGRLPNEMTRFRYDVVLRTAARTGVHVGRVVQAGEFTLDTLPALLADQTPFAICGLADSRVTADLAATQLLKAEVTPDTAAALRQELGGMPAAGIDPEDLRTHVAGWEIELQVSADDPAGVFDALLWPVGTDRPTWAATASATGPETHEPKTDRGQLIHALKQHLRAQLPPYMVPGVFVLLDTLPLTANGKVDRKALPDPAQQRQDSAATYVAPGTEFEQTIAGTWQDLLAVDRVGLNDNFFDIGANSLLMIQAQTALRERLGVPVSLVDLFRFPTVSTLAAFLNKGEASSTALSESDARAQARKDALNRRRRPGRPPAVSRN